MVVSNIYSACGLVDSLSRPQSTVVISPHKLREAECVL